jgi:hypothetical protein
MSTVEIAERTGRQDAHVLRDAETMLAAIKEDRSNFGGIFYDSYGRPQPCLNLPKLESLILVSDYSAELRGHSHPRWRGHEAGLGCLRGGAGGVSYVGGECRIA